MSVRPSVFLSVCFRDVVLNKKWESLELSGVTANSEKERKKHIIFLPIYFLKSYAYLEVYIEMIFSCVF